jgi:hypothetical protein
LARLDYCPSFASPIKPEGACWPPGRTSPIPAPSGGPDC